MTVIFVCRRCPNQEGWRHRGSLLTKDQEGHPYKLSETLFSGIFNPPEKEGEVCFLCLKKLFCYSLIPPNYAGNPRSVAIWSRNPLLSVGRVNSSLVPDHTALYSVLTLSFITLCDTFPSQNYLSPDYGFFHLVQCLPHRR